ncbi:MAG: hypothetical protein LH614_06085 [Pyrinomonadaceae bacterium]|nr:hypothetical protein [Pyrinomonadaceae bacterium]
MISIFKFQVTGFKFQVSGYRFHRNLFVFLTLLLTAHCSLLTINAQRRDHLTEQEVELVRDAQQIDERMKVFVKAIDRRWLVINNDNSQAKQVEKDLNSWGELPTGTRAQLLKDIEKLLDEAISKIDDVAARDMKSDFFPISVHILADGANKFLPQLKAQLDKSIDEKEKGSILGAIDYCNEIIEASGKVKRETPKEIKKRKEKESKSSLKDS